MNAAVLPPQIQVLERGWLSSNNILLFEGDEATLVDSGYVTHAPQTLALLRHALAGRRLSRLINTHSHSDHIGGNAAVQGEFGCGILVPEGIGPAVHAWDEQALLLPTTAQVAAPFRHDATIAPGEAVALGGLSWQALAAPGHDMHALVFHCAEAGILISGDALWRDGFGIIFADVLGEGEGLKAARSTLEAIARLPVQVVIPGHGAPFTGVEEALERAFGRLAAFEQDPARMARNAIRACFTFALLEKRRMALADLPDYLAAVPLYRDANARFLGKSPGEFAQWLVAELERAGAVRREGEELVPLMAP